LLVLLFTGNVYSQSNNNIEVTWWNILYDEEGNEKGYKRADTLNYNRLIIVKIFFNGHGRNDFVKCTIVDDEGNICFEEIKEITNDEILLRCRLLTTEEYLLNAIEPNIKFKCVINIMNEQFFESEFIDVIFTLTMVISFPPDTFQHDKYLLKSSDGSYEHEIDLEDDVSFITKDTYGRKVTHFAFPNVLPGKVYTLIYTNANSLRQYTRGEDIPFHELLNTIEKETVWRRRLMN
jgi:hypothetical protein